MREHASTQRLLEIEMALAPPLDVYRADGTPMFWGTEDEAWAEFQAQVGGGS